MSTLMMTQQTAVAGGSFFEGIRVHFPVSSERKYQDLEINSIKN